MVNLPHIRRRVHLPVVQPGHHRHRAAGGADDGWHGWLSARLDRGEGRGFYGVIAVPIMVVMMLIASRATTMGVNVIGPRLRLLGWLATAAMAATVIALLVTSWA